MIEHKSNYNEIEEEEGEEESRWVAFWSEFGPLVLASIVWLAVGLFLWWLGNLLFNG